MSGIVWKDDQGGDQFSTGASMPMSTLLSFRTARAEPTDVEMPPLAGEIREIAAAEKTLFCEHLLRLDPETRRNRFAMSASDEFLRSYAETCFALDLKIFGYFEDGVLRGTGELRPLDDAATAEATFCIERGWRRRRIGTLLMEEVLDAARTANTLHVYINCLATNQTMQALARKFAARFTYQAGDMIGLIEAPRSGGLQLFYTSAVTRMEAIFQILRQSS